MTFVANDRRTRFSADELRQRIPGWGTQLNPDSDSNSKAQPVDTGAHWEFPERQPEAMPRERSIEHESLTPVFGTAQPLHEASGAVRRLAYGRYSEGSTAHWLLLVLADRIDASGAHARSMISLRPDNPITQTGILSEAHKHPISSRFRAHRADTRHMWMDPVIVGAPWIVAGAGLALAIKKVRHAH